MKLKTLAVMLGLTSALTGCASTPELNSFVNTLLQPPPTAESIEESNYAAEKAAKYDANGNPKEARCKELERSLALSDRADQIKCAEQATNQTNADYSSGTESLTARNPPSIDTLGDARQEGETIFDRETGMYRKIITDRQVQLTDTGFSMDYAPMNDPTIYKMEFRAVQTDECQGLPGMEQTVWADHKDGAPKVRKVHCFENGEKRFINMWTDLNDQQGRTLFVDGSLSSSTPWVHVYVSELRKVY